MGLGLRHLHTTQELIRLKDLIAHNFQQTDTGKLYKTSLETLYIELGLGTDLDLIPLDIIHSLASNSLVKSTCLFVRQHL